VAELDDRGRDAADGLLAKVTAVARVEATRAVAEKLNNVVEGGRLNWDMLTQWGHHLLDDGAEVPIRPKLDLVGFTVADDPAGDLTRVTGSSGGGTGGDWVELASHIVPAGGGEGSMDFPSLPQTYRSLVAVGDNIQYVSYSAVDGKPICFLANAWNGNDYVQRIHRYGYDGSAINDVATPTPGNSGAIGYAPGPAGDEPVSSFVCWFPGYTNTTKYKTYHGHAEYSFGSTTLGFDVGGFARLALASHVNVDQLTFYANYSAGGAALDLFAPGSRITIYGVSGPNGGGGGDGGGWSLVERLTVASPTDDLAFATIPSTGDMLMLVSQGSVIVSSGQVGALYGLLLNGDLISGAAKYRDLFTEVDGYPSSASTSHYTTLHDALGTIGAFGASLSGSTPDNGGGVSVCYIPGFTVAKPITAISQSQNYHQNLTSFGTGAQVVQGTYTFTYDDNGPLTALHVHCGNGGQFAVGTTFALYVLNGGGTGGGTAFVGAKAHDTGGIVCPSGSITTVAFDDEYWDTGALHDVATNNERVTVPADGYYRVSARVELERHSLSVTADPFYGLLQLLRSGSTVAEDMVSTTPAAFNAGHRIVLKIEEEFLCTAGQYFSLTVQQNAGVSVVTSGDSWRQARLGVERVG
jgi:hypothetical protein